MKKFLILLALIPGAACAPAAEKRYVFSRPLMFTQFDLVLYSTLPRRQMEQEAEKVWLELDYWFQALSPAGTGAAGILNKEGFLSPEHDARAFPVISNFIAQAKKINKQSNGAFDLTVYPLVRLWGFYKQDEYRIPSGQEIKDVLKNIGMNKVSFENGGIRLSEGARLDYGAIAKGFAVDRAVKMLLETQGINAGIVNAGGNLRIFGNKPDGAPWAVGVRDPNGEEAQEIIPMYDGESIATSGDYEQFFKDPNGKIYHHIFNPKTGYPAEHNLASVSVVVQDSAETADMLSTTFLASGRSETLRLVKELGIEASVCLFFIEREGEELKIYANENWTKRKAELNRQTPAE